MGFRRDCLRSFIHKFKVMEGQGRNIKEEIQKLIIDSCDFELRPNEDFQNFHKTFLKFSFGVLDVELDYDANTISTWSSKPLTRRAIELGNYENAFFEKVNYDDLEETLLGCLAAGSFNERFYKHMLYELDRIPNENEMKTA